MTVPSDLAPGAGYRLSFEWTGVTPGPSKLATATPVAGWATGGGANSFAISNNANTPALYAMSGVLHVPPACSQSAAGIISSGA